ncbi:MAG: ATP-dependent DNA helicase UvrD2 [Actinomycetes bacterium]
MPAACDPDALLSGLDAEQRQVVLAPAGPVCVLAGAGTGKTRAITHRLAYRALTGGLDPSRVLALTFTTRAAGELRSRLARLGVPRVRARTFHSAALRQLQYFWPQVASGPAPSLVTAKAALLGEVALRLGVRHDRASVRDLAGEIEWAKAVEISAEEYPAAASAAGRQPPAGLDPSGVGRVYHAYEQAKSARSLLDFEDVLLVTAGMLAARPDIAAQVAQTYRYLTVDEFQDVNPVQRRLVELWLDGGRDICVVGDTAQTIYSFAGADARFLTEFPARYPDAQVVWLERDYRSTPQVVSVANRLLRGAPRRPTGPRLTLVAQRPDGPDPRVLDFPDEVSEARWVADEATRLLTEGYAARDIAVLVRTNAQTAAFEEALTARSVPFVVRGAARFFDRAEVRQALTLLRGAVRADPGRPSGGLAAGVGDILATLGWGPQAPGGAAARTRWESLSALVGLAEELVAEDPEATLVDLVADLQSRATAQHAPVADGVTVASMHAAKGLEWRAVMIAGLAEGIVPISYAESPDALAEERRLLYVAITRARDQLVLTWAAARAPGSRARRRRSRFLDEALGTDSGAPRARREPGSPRRPTASCRVCHGPLRTAAERAVGRCAECPGGADPRLVEQLRGWRRGEAERAKVPAYCVFTDATLIAIAEHRPTSPAELLRVPGVGQVKLERYALAVLEICGTGGTIEDATGDAPVGFPAEIALPGATIVS